MVDPMEEIDPVARQEAAAWHARLQSRAVSNAELDAFYAWRETFGNARAFDAIENLWSQSTDLRDDPDIMFLLRGAGRPRWTPFALMEVFRNGWRSRMVGAGLLSLLAVMVVMLVMKPTGQPYRTGIGERLTVRLDDGSRVTLNTASRISVRLSKTEREIVLEEGQVMFEVAHDPNRPFRVVSRGTSVTAIGTVFQVARDAFDTRVVLIKGRISIKPAAAASPTFLGTPGDTLDVGGRRSAIGRSDPTISSSWLNGKIDLRDVPLQEAIAEVNRYTERRIILDVPSEGRTKVSGMFATGDPDAFAAAVEALLPLDGAKDQDGKIHLVEKR